MKNMILLLALVFAGSVSFAGVTATNKSLTVDKAITCFVKSLKPEAFNAVWMDGKQDFMKRVKNNENMPVLGDELSGLVSKYMSDAAFTADFQAVKNAWIKQAADANTEKTVARALWDLRQYISPSMITEKGAKEMAKYDGQLKVLAS